MLLLRVLHVIILFIVDVLFHLHYHHHHSNNNTSNSSRHTQSYFNLYPGLNSLQLLVSIGAVRYGDISSGADGGDFLARSQQFAPIYLSVRDRLHDHANAHDYCGEPSASIASSKSEKCESKHEMRDIPHRMAASYNRSLIAIIRLNWVCQLISFTTFNTFSRNSLSMLI